MFPLPDIDECVTMNISCEEKEICKNIPGSFTCACVEGYGKTDDAENCISMWHKCGVCIRFNVFGMYMYYVLPCVFRY